MYHLKKTKANIQDHPYIKYLLEEKCILDRKPNNIKIITSTDDFIEFYEKIFKIQYDEAKKFLVENGIEPSAKKSFTLEDVKYPADQVHLVGLNNYSKV